MPANIPGFELGRYFLMFSRGDWHAGRWVILSLAITLLVAAFALWKAYRLDRVAAVVLGLGLLMVIPNFGSWLVGHSGLPVSGFDTPSYFSFKMLITALGTLALGLVAYAYLPKVNPRDRCLLAAACGAFLLMLPVTAVIWYALPGFRSCVPPSTDSDSHFGCSSCARSIEVCAPTAGNGRSGCGLRHFHLGSGTTAYQ